MTVQLVSIGTQLHQHVRAVRQVPIKHQQDKHPVLIVQKDPIRHQQGKHPVLHVQRDQQLPAQNLLLLATVIVSK